MSKLLTQCPVIKEILVDRSALTLAGDRIPIHSDIGLEYAEALYETILRQRNYEEVPFSRILAMLEKYRGIERVKERAQAFTDKARNIMHEFPESPYQRALLTVTELVTDRDH